MGRDHRRADRQPLDRPYRGVNSVAFSRDGKILATGSKDGAARLWDVATQRPIGGPLTGHAGPVTSVAFSPDGKTLATGSSDGTAGCGTWPAISRSAALSP